MSRPAGSADHLEGRGKKAIDLVERDRLSPAETARRLKVNVRTVRTWIALHRGLGYVVLRPALRRGARLAWTRDPEREK